MFARMKADLHFLSTDFKLKEGEVVEVEDVKLPGHKRYWVRPVDGRWAGASMIVEPEDIKIF